MLAANSLDYDVDHYLGPCRVLSFLSEKWYNLLSCRIIMVAAACMSLVQGLTATLLTSWIRY
jgi:thiamine transporter ThiT